MSTGAFSSSSSSSSKRVVDYFVVAGLSPKTRCLSQLTGEADSIAQQRRLHQQLLYPDLALDAPKSSNNDMAPVVDLCVLDKNENELVPQGYECLWQTPAKHSADLNHGSLGSHEMFLCLRRGYDKPPIVDLGVFYEDSERPMSGCHIIKQTVGGHSANVNNNSITGNRIFITYRRAMDLACNSFAVTDICVIIKSKNEQAPHSYLEIGKNLNRGLFGASVFLCYKKALIPAPQIKYTPHVLYRYPVQHDHDDVPFPTHVATFGLPMGAVIECWPVNVRGASATKPFYSTFVLNVNSDEQGKRVQKVYGASLTFYEDYDPAWLVPCQAARLGYDESTRQDKVLKSNKCLILLSRYPFFDAFKHFLLFIYLTYSNKSGDALKFQLPIERYLSYVVNEVPFPTVQKPRVFVNLTERDDDCLSLHLPPDELVLPQSGASYIELLRNLGTENSINVFLAVLLQRNVMVHSLRRAALTGVVEAVSCIIFPFMWNYSYIPMCPLNLCRLIEAPGSFIFGMDSRYFDLFDPPTNVICADLDTNKIYWPDEATRQLIHKHAPKRPLSVLRARLTQLLAEISQYNLMRENVMTSLSTESRFRAQQYNDQQTKLKRKERHIEICIREAFLRFMAALLHNYKHFLRTVTRRPDLKTLDRTLESFFDRDGFVRSKDSQCQPFYKELTQTQLFVDCVMNLSFATELEPPHLADSFVFFDSCCSKVNASLSEPNERDESRLIDEAAVSYNDQTVVVLPPTIDSISTAKLQEDRGEQPVSTDNDDALSLLSAMSDFVYESSTSPSPSFPKLKEELKYINMSKEALRNELLSGESSPHSRAKPASAVAVNAETDSLSSMEILDVKRPYLVAATPIGVRSKAEKLATKRKLESTIGSITSAVKKQVKTTPVSARSPSLVANLENFRVAKARALHFLSNSYAVFFIYLPEYLKTGISSSGGADSHKQLLSGLNYAYHVLVQMQRHGLGTHADEICYRVIMQLCLLYKMPALAVKTLIHMRKYKIEMSPITYSFYNKVLIEPSHWPSIQKDHWARIRLLWTGVMAFRNVLRLKRAREEEAKRKMTTRQRRRLQQRRRSSGTSQQLKKGGAKQQQQQKKPSVKKQLPSPPPLPQQVKATPAAPQQTKQEEAAQPQPSAEPQQPVLVPAEATSSHPLEQQDNNNHQRTTSTSSGIYSTLKRGGHAAIIKQQSSSASNRHRHHSHRTTSPRHTRHHHHPRCCRDYVHDQAGLLLTYARLPTSSSTKRPRTTLLARALSFDQTLADTIKVTFLPQEKRTTLTPQHTPSPPPPQPSPSSVVVVYNDPLGAFAQQAAAAAAETPATALASTTAAETSADDGDGMDSIRKRLFAEPFEEERLKEKQQKLQQQQQQQLQQQQQQSKQQDNVSAKVSNVSYESSDIYDDEETETEPDEDVDEDDALYDDYSYQGENGSMLSDEEDDDDEEDDYDSDENEDILADNEDASEASSRTRVSYHYSNPVVASVALDKQQSQTSASSSKSSSSAASSLFSSGLSRLRQGIEKLDLKSNTSKMSNQLMKASAAIFTNVNQEELTSKLKSFSGYNLANGAVNSANSNSSLQLPNGKAGAPLTPSSSQTSLDAKILNAQQQQTLERLPKDDTYQALSYNWWSYDEVFSCSSDIVLDVQMSSCNYCETCASYLYDEEIMSGWSLDDSDMNSKCAHCGAFMVPQLYVRLQDLDEMRRYFSSSYESRAQIKTNLAELHVHYLSPLVLRKELENIIVNYNQQHESAQLIDEKFMTEKNHIVYWNLVWYFKRIGVDSGQLVTLLLNSRLRALYEQQQIASDKRFEFKFSFPRTKATKPYHTHPNVRIKCMWDNLQMHEHDKIYEIPLYISWLSKQKDINDKKLTVLSSNEIKMLRKSSSNPRSLDILFDLIARNIQENEVTIPIKNLLRERTRSRIIYASIYREILYLVLIILKRYRKDTNGQLLIFDNDAFDNEYREAYIKIVNSNDMNEQLKPSDRPPNNMAVWCRRIFSPLCI